MRATTVAERRFGFGDNWLDFARGLQPAQILEAEESLRSLLGCDTLAGSSFLDIGSGSGLFSLAARRLGARVHSFDYDIDSVDCTEKLRDLHCPGDPNWTVTRGSVLDREYLRGVGTFDIVYCWGVLHHTGAMHDALAASSTLVKPGGLFAFALYRRTPLCGLWRLEKRWYTAASPRAQGYARAAFVTLFRLACVLTYRSFQSYVANYRSSRGMDFAHNVHDWLAATPMNRLRPARSPH